MKIQCQLLYWLQAVTKYKDLNNYSAVIRIAFGNTAFLFMGDAEIESENEILSNYNIESLWANVIKIGHHGSSSSSQQAFLSKGKIRRLRLYPAAQIINTVILQNKL